MFRLHSGDSAISGCGNHLTQALHPDIPSGEYAGNAGMHVSVAAKSIQEKAFANPKIAFMWDSVVVKVDAFQFHALDDISAAFSAELLGLLGHAGDKAGAALALHHLAGIVLL